jgi:hypothetical protein
MIAMEEELELYQSFANDEMGMETYGSFGFSTRCVCDIGLLEQSTLP